MMVVLAVAVIGPPTAVAQATRTWVSGVGDDVNPCSRTAPCKTFAGAISKTAAGGEINCLDPGGFGAVTIIKSMTIDCEYTEGGALAGGNGIVLNMPAATDVAFIRGLDIFGVNPPTNGIRFVNNGTLHVDNVRIKRFNASGSFGISYQPSGASELFISNTIITDNGSDGSNNGGGILVQPTGPGGTARVVLDNVSIVNNVQGLRADSTGGSNVAGIKVSVTNSRATGNKFAGFAAVTTAGSPAVEMMVDSSTASYNGGAGFTANGVNTMIRMSRCLSTGNATGTLPNNSGVIESYLTNMIRGNSVDGTRTAIPTQE